MCTLKEEFWGPKEIQTVYENQTFSTKLDLIKNIFSPALKM
tara:strand:+ start:739 stop:861 length:123 start_codon:yes stop_codon:yes gene_type:complete